MQHASIHTCVCLYVRANVRLKKGGALPLFHDRVALQELVPVVDIGVPQGVRTRQREAQTQG